MFLEVTYLSLARVWLVKSKGVGVAVGSDQRLAWGSLVEAGALLVRGGRRQGG